MSEHEPGGEPERSGPQGHPEGQARASLGDEVQEFGRQLGEALRVARESSKAREVEQQVTQALRDLEKDVAEAFHSVREKAVTPNLQGSVKQTARSAAEEVQRHLALGIRAINEAIRRKVEEVERGRTIDEAHAGTPPEPPFTWPAPPPGPGGEPREGNENI